MAAQRGQSFGALDAEPEIFSDLLPVWEAFWILHAGRPVGMTVGAIPLGEMAAYFGIHEIRDPDTRREYLALVRAMDGAYLNWQRAREKK